MQAAPGADPVTEDPSRCAEYMELVDGLLIPGGEDIAPEYYGEDPVPPGQLHQSGEGSL